WSSACQRRWTVKSRSSASSTLFSTGFGIRISTMVPSPVFAARLPAVPEHHPLAATRMHMTDGQGMTSRRDGRASSGGADVILQEVADIVLEAGIRGEAEVERLLRIQAGAELADDAGDPVVALPGDARRGLGPRDAGHGVDH